MPYTPTADDPFTPQRKSPSLSWKSLPVGSTFQLKVLEPAKLIQGRDFLTQEPKFWDAEKTRPVMSAVLNVTVLDGPHSVGEERSVWAQVPSDLFNAIAQSQLDAQAKIDTGGTLYLRFAGETPHQDPRMNPIKNYQAKYEPPKTPVPDVFASTPAPAPQGQPAPTQAAPQPGMQTWGNAAQPTTPRVW